MLPSGDLTEFLWFSVLFPAWCLRSEGVSSVLLGVSTADQLLENLGALRVRLIPHVSNRVICLRSVLNVLRPLWLQILSQMTPQTITEIDALLGNKPHSKKELRA